MSAFDFERTLTSIPAIWVSSSASIQNLKRIWFYIFQPLVEHEIFDCTYVIFKTQISKGLSCWLLLIKSFSPQIMAMGLNNFQSEQNVLSWADAEYQWVKMKNWAKFWKVMNFGNKFGLILSCITISNYSLDLKVHKISITFGRYSCSNGNDQSLRFCFWFIFNSLKINFPIIVKVFSHIWWFVFVAILLMNTPHKCY